MPWRLKKKQKKLEATAHVMAVVDKDDNLIEFEDLILFGLTYGAVDKDLKDPPTALRSILRRPSMRARKAAMWRTAQSGLRAGSSS